MSWEVSTQTEPVASKDYHCDAAHWILNSGYEEQDYEPEDWKAIKKAESEGWRILKGTPYICVRGKFDGEFCTYRARKDLNDICLKYELFE